MKNMESSQYQGHLIVVNLHEDTTKGVVGTILLEVEFLGSLAAVSCFCGTKGFSTNACLVPLFSEELGDPGTTSPGTVARASAIPRMG